MTFRRDTPDSDGVLTDSLELSRQGRFEENERLLRDAIDKRPEDAHLAMRMGQALTYRVRDSRESRDEAAAWALRAADLAPKDPTVLLRAASLLFFLGDVETSREVLREAHAEASDDFAFASDLVHLAGRLALARGDKDRAERGLRAAFEADPAVPGHGRVLAKFYADEGCLEDAESVARLTLEHFPDDQELRGLLQDGHWPDLDLGGQGFAVANDADTGVRDTK